MPRSTFREYDPKTRSFVSITDEKRIIEKIGQQISRSIMSPSDDAPTLIIHGDADKLVPIQQAEIILEKLKAAGVPTELVVTKGQARWLGRYWKRFAPSSPIGLISISPRKQRKSTFQVDFGPSIFTTKSSIMTTSCPAEWLLCAVIAVIVVSFNSERGNADEPAKRGNQSRRTCILPTGNAKSQRDETRPRFSFDPGAGPDGTGAFVISTSSSVGENGWFQKSFPVTGGKFVRFLAVRKG